MKAQIDTCSICGKTDHWGMMAYVSINSNQRLVCPKCKPNFYDKEGCAKKRNKHE